MTKPPSARLRTVDPSVGPVWRKRLFVSAAFLVGVGMALFVLGWPLAGAPFLVLSLFVFIVGV